MLHWLLDGGLELDDMTKRRNANIIYCCVAIILAAAAGAAWFWFNREPDAEYGMRTRFDSAPERTATVDMV